MRDPLTEKLQPLCGVRQSKESDAAVQACNDFLRMGAGRSLVGLANKYSQELTFRRDFKPPSTNYDTLRQWSSSFSWSSRASEYDATWEQRKNELREQAFNEGLALDFERITELKKLALLLHSQIYERGETGVFHNLWVPDVKQIGSGEFTERVDIERYNSALVSDYRAVLDDLAKEVGDRVKRVDLGIEITIVQKLIAQMQQAGLNPSDVFNTMIEKMAHANRE